MAVRTVWNVSFIAVKLWFMAPCNLICWFSGKCFPYPVRATLLSSTKILITVTRCELRGWNLYRSNGFFTFLRGTDPLCGPPSLLFKENWGSFPGVKPPVRAVYHLPPPSAEVEIEWRYDQRFESQHDQEVHLLCKPSISVLEPTQPTLQRLPGLFS